MIIYCITNDVNDKIYIGQSTKTLEERIMWHRNAFVSAPYTHLYQAMHKYGWDMFHFTVIDDSATTKQELDELEKYYIKKYDSIVHGYNMTEGGESNPMDCEKSRSKHNARMRDPNVRSRISESMKKSYLDRGGPSAEHRKHLSDQKKAMYASKQGDEVRAKFRANYTFTPEHREAANEGRRKGVYCIDTESNIIAEFHTVKDAAQWWLENGYHVKSYDQLCDRIKESFVQDKYVHGLKWIYQDRQAGYRV